MSSAPRETGAATLTAFIPSTHEGRGTIAAQILRTVAGMRKDGTFETSSLCWSPAQLEKLAMFAIDAKHKLARAGWQSHIREAE